jgi:predicted DNA-binding WGR domain protein
MKKLDGVKEVFRRFEFTKGRSNKFWSVFCEEDVVFFKYGKIGAAGSFSIKEFSSNDDAIKHVSKMVKEKTAKGYKEV